MYAYIIWLTANILEKVIILYQNGKQMLNSKLQYIMQRVSNFYFKNKAKNDHSDFDEKSNNNNQH